jgi:2-polyprenyl-3-methyl-5-hydroxy-6-metoxy-1,4-benzoquinol methylase
MDASEEVIKFWDEYPCGRNTGSIEEESRWRYGRENWIPGIISKYFTNKEILEIGCGAGVDSYNISFVAKHLVALEPSKSSIKLAKKYSADRNNVTFVNDRVENINKIFKKKEFDIVYCYGVLHHVINTEKAIRDIHNLLKEDGLAIIMIYNKYPLRYVREAMRFFRWFVSDTLDGGGTRYIELTRCPVWKTYTEKEIRRMFRDYSSLEIKKVKYGLFSIVFAKR